MSQLSSRHLLLSSLQQLHCDFCAGLRVGEGVVVVRHRATAGLGHGVQLVVWQSSAEVAARSPTGTIELIIRIVHLIDTEHGLEAALIKSAVMRHQRQPLNHGLYSGPHLGEHGSAVSIGITESMHLLAPVIVIVGLRLDK